MQCNIRFRKHINNLARIAAVGLVSLYLFGCSSYRGISVRSSNENVSEAFLTAALGREGRFSDDVLSKWCGPVGVTLPAAVPDDRRERVLSELNSLSGLTAVDFQVGADPGIEMHYPATSTEMGILIAALPIDSAANRRRVTSARCFFVLQADQETGCLFKADVVLPAALDGPSFDHCIVEEFSQSMGLPNDIDAGDGSIFSRTGRPQARTPLDDLFLKVLYDPALEAGSSRTELEAAVPDLIRKHR
ncbi:DUF2927 domain-containing protein [Hwanghaeella grinnelliae]|uniref:DUF2927 domain-containing protein n=1 Tax=Hwanghaeella grinnelliae TaxID=2500179 RepID=UPI001F0291E2|nr:DUF2927 domain-containing protein [Hwanghaeella grinnelliae]